MDVKTIRDEISKIDGLLASVEADIRRISPEEEPDPKLIENEYTILLSALSTAGQPTSAFQSLEDDDVKLKQQSVVGLDAFTFFGLLQAFIEDPIVLKCLSKQFSSVVGVTPTQLEDSLDIAERITDLGAQRIVLVSIIDRIVTEIESGKISNFSIVASVCQRASLLKEPEPNASLVRLLQTRGWENWPLFVQIELAYYFHPFVSKAQGPNIMKMFTCCVVDSVVGEDGSQLERNTLLHSPRTCYQLLDLVKCVGRPGVTPEKNIAYIEKCVSRNSLGIPGQARLASDWHCLVVRMAETSFLQNDASLPVWANAVERLVTSSSVFENFGTLSALTAVQITNESIFSNLVAFKKRISSPDLTREELEEIVDHLVIAGDRSTGSALSKAILERRDLFLPSSGTLESFALVAKIVLLAAVASVESGTIIPESILILKKFASQILSSIKDVNIFICLMQLLLPSTDVENLIGQSLPAPSLTTPMSESAERVKKALHAVGFSIEAPNCELLCNGRIEGIHADFVFNAHRIAILVDQEAFFSTSSKRYVVSGPMALKANILTQRKGFKVIVIVPAQYPDEKSLVSLLAEPLRKMQPNSIVIFNSMDECKLSLNQRIKNFVSVTSSFVEIARVLYMILKCSVQVSEFRFENVFFGDRFINLIFCEFLSTYLVKHKHDIVIACSSSCKVSSEGLLKLVEALNASGNASNGFGSISFKIRLEQDIKDYVIARWNETHLNSVIKLVDSGNSMQIFDANVIYI